LNFCCIPFELRGIKCNKRLDSNKDLCSSNISKHGDDFKRIIHQDKSKSDLIKEHIQKTSYRNVIRDKETSQERERRLANWLRKGN
jgi:hypothetical protein